MTRAPPPLAIDFARLLLLLLTAAAADIGRCNGLRGEGTGASIESCPMEKADYFAPVEVEQAADTALPALRIRQGEVLNTADEAVRTGGTLWPAGQVGHISNRTYLDALAGLVALKVFRRERRR